MKKTLSVLLLCALAVSMMLTLASCGGLSGTYDGMLFDLKFKGDDVTVLIGDKELKGTYEIKENDDKKPFPLISLTRARLPRMKSTYSALLIPYSVPTFPLRKTVTK